MTALARIEPTPIIHETSTAWIDLVQPAADLAQQIAATEFVPKEMRNRPAVIAACILFGSELGLGPMVSLAKIAVVNGKPAPYAELARALALGAGHEMWVEEQTNTRVKVSGRRRGSQQIHTVTWTLDDVRKAGISSPMYAKFPRQMLYARASAELVRQMAPEVLGGITVFAEEVGDPEPADTIVAAAEPAKATTRRRATTTPTTPAQPPEHPKVVDEPPPLPDELEPRTEPEPMTDSQRRKMMAGFKDIGVTERQDRLDFVEHVLDEPRTSSALVNRQEAAQIIDTIDQVANGTLELVYVDGHIRLIPPEPDQ